MVRGVTFLSVVAAGLLIGACSGARGAVVEAPVELTVSPVASIDAGANYASGARASMGAACSVRLGLVGRIEKSSPGCFLDEYITKTGGLLRFPCSGDGPVEVDFGDHHYTGRLTGGNVELEVSTELDWEDGCRWGTRSVISGPLVAKGEPLMKTLAWRYRDHVISGASCSGICVASASIQVTKADGSGPGSRRPMDDDDEYE